VSTPDEAPRAGPAAGEGFRLEGVTVTGGQGPVLEGFSAHLPGRGLTAVVGPSGSGKTTLLRLLNRLADPDAGRITYDGRPLAEHDVLDLRRRVQHVGQVPVAFPGTVADNLRLARPWAPVADLLARVDLDPELAGREAQRLSVGETQRMCLARALALAPECLLLDEPTSALDGDSRSRVEKLVRRLADDGTGVIMVTHDASQAQDLADRTVAVPGRR